MVSVLAAVEAQRVDTTHQALSQVVLVGFSDGGCLWVAVNSRQPHGR